MTRWPLGLCAWPWLWHERRRAVSFGLHVWGSPAYVCVRCEKTWRAT